VTITVRYFAGAQVAAGTGEEILPLPDGTGLPELVTQLSDRHGPDLARVLAAASFLINEVTGADDRHIPDGATVDVLPPFAGG
jgi:molybdopterin synthase sulfur carrier subunit